MKTTITILSLTAVLAGLTLWAQESPRSGTDVASDPRLKRFDKNGDGKIDDSERQAIREFMRQRGRQQGSMTPFGKTETVGNREITEMEYASSDGRKIPCVLSMPKGDGPFPCVVTIHGGQGNRDLAYIRTLAAPNPISPTVNTLNEQPWAILAISYRSGEGVMSDGEQADVVAGIRFAKTLPKIDASRVGVLGGSHGGHLALRAAELMGNEFLCVAVGSPWMTDPFVYMMGQADQPPLSQLSAAARKQIMSNGQHLLKGMKTRGLSDAEVKAHLAKNSIEANAEKIVIPSLFMTSLSDEQAPHLLVKPTFDRLKAGGRDVTVFTVEKSPHGFYWGRSVGGARIGRGEKSETELAEEKATREQIVTFFTKQFARTDVKAVASPNVNSGPKPETKAESQPDSRIKPTASQSAAIRKLRERMANLPVPENLQRRTLKVGDREREFFINIPASVKGKPAPVVFALHGGASSSGLAQHLKVDYTKLGEQEGYVTIYPSGVNGWNIGSHNAYSVKRRTSDADDIGFFSAMFDTLIQEGVADPQRIYLTGGSNGGVMTQFLVCHPAPRRQSALERIRDQYGDIKPTAHTEEIAEQRPGEPPLKKMPDGDPARDAAGRGQLFESIVVPGFTSIQEGMNGLAIVDLNKDGRLDIVATYSAPRGAGGRWGEGEKLRVFINDGGFQFHPHTIKLLDSKVTPENFGRGQVPNLADFNGDGFLDLFVTRHAQMSGGQSNPRDQKLGNGLYLSEGAWDVFRDVSAKMGIQNEKAYNRQPSIGDVNKDGHLDVAVGCDNIKDAQGGFPHSRLYVFKPEVGRAVPSTPRRGEDTAPHPFDGHFEDTGGTDLVPDFGSFYHDSAKDKAGPDINLRDLDNDGDLDLIQSYHVDVLDVAAPYSPIEYRQGVFCWKNLLAQTGKLQFEKITGNGLACEAHLKLDANKQSTEPVGKAPGLPYISLADVDNDGLLDVLAVGPASPGWAPRTEYVSGRFWRNKDGFHFQEATDVAGLSALNWVYRDWCKFFEMPAPKALPGAPMDPGDRRPYLADAIFGDFNNDGWLDLVAQDRHESPNLETRAILFMNRGDGSFEVKPTTFSGLDSMGICGEAADLNNDGLLDLVFAADPDNSGPALSLARYESKVYWNTGLHGAKESHWLRLRFSGVTDAELIGARVELTASGKKQYRWIHANHSYKSGGALEAHFGLGEATDTDVTVTLPVGKSVSFASVKADQYLDLNLETAQSIPALILRKP